VSVPSGPAFIGSVIASIPDDANPQALAYDNASGMIYVANLGLGPAGTQSNVTILEGVKTMGSVAVGSTPLIPTADESNGLVYVPNLDSRNISFLSGLHSEGSIAVGSRPDSIAVNSTSGTAYVTNSGGSNVSVITDARINTTVDVNNSGPYCSAFDPLDGYIYVGDEPTSNVSVISGTRLVATVPVGLYPSAILADPATGFVYVANGGSYNVSILNGTAVIGSVNVSLIPYNLLYNPSNGYVYIAGDLGSGDTGIYVLNGSQVVQFVDLGFESSFGNPEDMAFDASNDLVYKANLIAGITVIQNTTIVGSISLPNGEPNDIIYDPANEDLYVTAWNWVDVISTHPKSFSVNFTEAGLPPGSGWSVTLDGSQEFAVGTTIGFIELNGTYEYTLGGVPGFVANRTSGSVTVQGGAVDISVRFSPRLYPVIFTETGLRPGTNWSVTLGSETNSSKTAEIGFQEPNATSCDYTVAVVPGYSENPSDGSFSVAGSQVDRSVEFSLFLSPLGARGWANVTQALGETYYCVDHSGKVGIVPASLQVSLAAVAWNGTGPYAYVWTFGDGSQNVDSARTEHTFEGNGTWVANLTVVDLNGGTNTTHYTLHASAQAGSFPSCPKNSTNSSGLNPLSGGGFSSVLVIVAIVAALVVAVVVMVFIRRRKGSNEND
jgi:DNA-binding beta-propeller fold protein YncE